KKKYASVVAKGGDQSDEIRQLKRELARVTEERDILKKAAVGSIGQRNMITVKMRWEDPQWHARDDRDYRLN
ncbi:hypothetical protein DC095_033310, partial [Streptomyces xinghaiensis]